MFTTGFCLAILNSQLITFFHQLIVPEAGRVFAEIKISDLQVIPIRRISFTTPAETRAALAAEAQGLAAAAVTTGDFTAVLAFVTAQLAAQPERSDVIHDLLAGLAEQMIAMNKQKGDEMRGFLAWLERETGAKIEDLTGRSQLRDYPGDYQKGETPLPSTILRQLRARPPGDPAQEHAQAGRRSGRSQVPGVAQEGVRSQPRGAAAAQSAAGRDRPADRSGGVSAVRTDGGRNRGGRRPERLNRHQPQDIKTHFTVE